MADIGTKVVDRERIGYLLGLMHIVRVAPQPRAGRVSTAKCKLMMSTFSAALTGSATGQEDILNAMFSVPSAAAATDEMQTITFWAFVLLRMLLGAVLREDCRHGGSCLLRLTSTTAKKAEALPIEEALEDLGRPEEVSPPAFVNAVRGVVAPPEVVAPTEDLLRPVLAPTIYIVSECGARVHTDSSCSGLRSAGKTHVV